MGFLNLEKKKSLTILVIIKENTVEQVVTLNKKSIPSGSYF